MTSPGSLFDVLYYKVQADMSAHTLHTRRLMRPPRPYIVLPNQLHPLIFTGPTFLTFSQFVFYIILAASRTCNHYRHHQTSPPSSSSNQFATKTTCILLFSPVNGNYRKVTTTDMRPKHKLNSFLEFSSTRCTGRVSDMPTLATYGQTLRTLGSLETLSCHCQSDSEMSRRDRQR